MAIDLRALFVGLQREMEARLEISRAAFKNAEYKGGASEDHWRRLLGTYLPRRYEVSKAIVIDSRGECSDAIDIVIYDRQYSPLIFEVEQQRYIPAEGVYAVLEVKQDLSRENMLYAGEKVASVRRLHRTSAPIATAAGLLQAKAPIPIIGGVVSLESSWDPPFGAAFAAALGELRKEQSLQLGLAVAHGAFITQDARVTVVQSKTALARWLTALLGELQSLGTVAAIDFAAYGRWAE